ncbi:NADPH-dependent assimilatory sulfite reductase hemoprotein subunit [Mangrovibacterium diazotrophicum]|uniref:Sulfite reductase [NADPH] hemoprotein beta-component n=1 Tax=Mangrovibacterium diazotrophicum TaxID=1261403 RepID=A0A419W514_9BACT|nr:NADPH-dependent assimilatory sulfite reductase hemoprotein subunit [Mangrovibacterium diazotrophicum]RKD90537.1 sulfite reductase (NADPH) beta subunit [Mangrovibacterium diazotrophicum]
MSEQIDWSKLSEVEKLKYDSNYLRGTLVESLADPVTGAIADGDTQMSKFHGIYQQHDRDLEKERKLQKLEPAWSFLIRVRLPGGVASREQWLQMDSLADTHANGTLKLTTRQAFQLHGVIKSKLKATIQGINSALMDTIAACGDVNRNVMSLANPEESEIHAQAYKLAGDISAHLTPQTTAYHEIWLDEHLLVDGKKDVEPIYGDRYLPRKFKIGVAVPPYNDVDVFSQDLGYIAIQEKGKLVGYNVVVGGGFGSTFGVPETYPRLGDVIGFCTPSQAVDVAEKVVLVQKDNGNRQNRKQARLKYTIDHKGLDWFKAELNKYLGYKLEPARPYSFSRNGDRYGWVKGTNGKWNLNLFIEGGRVKDTGNLKLKTALREIAEQVDAQFILTGNQNLILANLDDKEKVAKILKEYGVWPIQLSGLRQNSIACVALNTCSLAFAEAERYLPDLMSKIEVILDEHGLLKEEIVIRMTGCPNGCGRPYLAEIGFIGKSAGRYNLYLGGNRNGTRLNALYKETLSEEEILAELKPIIADYAQNRNEGEGFGDFVVRKAYVKEIIHGKEFKH